jgi:hypothetical protein
MLDKRDINKKVIQSQIAVTSARIIWWLSAILLLRYIDFILLNTKLQ